MILLALIAALAGVDYSKAGPYRVDDRDEGPCTVFAPVKLDKAHPVILWGNGTGGSVATYAPILRHWASHGFIVAAAKTGQAGTGQDMIGCLDRLAARNAEPGGFYTGRIDLAKVGASGHSQGAWGALNAARDKRVIATAPIQPGGGSLSADGISGQHGPMLLLSGSADRVASPERAQAVIFRNVRVPVTWGTLIGASHMTPTQGNGGPYRDVTAAWFAWRLMGDTEAGKLFDGPDCGLCRSNNWTIQSKG